MENSEKDANSEPNLTNHMASVSGLSKTYINQLHSQSRIYDPFIIDRLNEYLQENRHQTYVSIQTVTDALRRRYREYRRRNWNDFKKLVERAFAVLSKNLKNSMVSPGHSEVEESDSEVRKPQDVSTSSNAQVTGLYKHSNSQGKHNDMELINLSSDDEPKKDAEKDDEESDDRNLMIPFELLRPDLTVSRRRRVHRRASSQASKAPSHSSTTTTFANFAGNASVLQEVCQLILHMKHPEVYRAFGVSAPRGFLLHGPPGCGKTLLAAAIAGELKVPFIKVCGPELVGGVSGESEERIRELFSTAQESAPCVLFIDEVDAITPNRQTAQREMERRIVAQLISSLDDLSEKDANGQILVIGATKRPDALDPALRRAGRFDREVSIGIPNEKAREDILRLLCAKVPLSQDLQLSAIARMTPGFVGSDLLSLVRESVMVAITRVLNEIKDKKGSAGEEEEHATRKRKRSDDSHHLVKKPNLSSNGKKTSDSELDVIENNVDGINEVDGESNTKANHDNKNVAPDSITIDVVTPDINGLSDSNVDHHAIPDVDEVVVLPTTENSELTAVNSLMQWIRSSWKLNREQLGKLQLAHVDVMAALNTVQPSAKREGFATVPDVTWEDVGSLVAVRKHLKMNILGPVKYGAQFERLGLVAPTGVLLCGPPGCGKTLLAKAVANEAGINFISVKGPELLNMYVGESERAVRTVFQRARNSAPCVIFFDELDALCPRRTEGDAGAGMRVVNQMLTEMDGVGERRGVFLMAATNRPDIVDPAVLRPGRLDKTIYIGLPSPEDRKDILRAITKNGTKPPLAADVPLDDVALRAELKNFTGADLAALMRESAMQAMRAVLSDVDITASVAEGSDTLPNDVFVTMAHIQSAINIVRPSITNVDLQLYEEMHTRFGVNNEYV